MHSGSKTICTPQNSRAIVAKHLCDFHFRTNTVGLTQVVTMYDLPTLKIIITYGEPKFCANRPTSLDENIGANWSIRSSRENTTTSSRKHAQAWRQYCLHWSLCCCTWQLSHASSLLHNTEAYNTVPLLQKDVKFQTKCFQAWEISHGLATKA